MAIRAAAVRARSRRPTRAMPVAATVSLRDLARAEAIEPDAVAGLLGLTKTQLAATLGLPADALHRADRAGAAKTQGRLREMLEVLARIEAWAGGPLAAFAWYRSFGIASLGDETAEAMVRTGRADLVRLHLDGLAAGGYA